MNPMQDIHVRARHGGLASATHAKYFASKAFAERIRFEGEQGERDRVEMVLYMLEHVALDPIDLARGMGLLSRGVVALVFFGWCSPVPFMEPSAADVDRIRKAVERNVQGPLYAAALRVLKWRKRMPAGERGREKVLAHMRAGMTWPTGRGELARQETERLVGILNAKADAMRDLRLTRLARLRAAAGPREAGWTMFMHAMAVAVLTPASESEQVH